MSVSPASLLAAPRAPPGSRRASSPAKHQDFSMHRAVYAAVLFLIAIPLQAQEPIRFARSPALSPDARTVAFSYLGDLWTVDAKGGVAQQLTRHEKHDFNPVFSPDEQWIAFSSNRHGQYDVFVVPIKGGRPRRL